MEYINCYLNKNENNKNEIIECSISEHNFEKYTCVTCNYKTERKNNYNRHLQSVKHLNTLSSNENIHVCLICNYTCSKKSNYNVHLKSNKHIQNEKLQDIDKKETKIEEFKNEVISTLITQFSSILDENHKSVLAEQTKLMIEQHKMNKMITDIANKPTNSITNNNNNNQTNNKQPTIQLEYVFE